MTIRREKILELLAARNGGHRPPPPPPPPPPPVDTGDDDAPDDQDLLFQQAMAEVVRQALTSDVDLHRDEIGEANLILQARIAVELGNIRYLLQQAIEEN